MFEGADYCTTKEEATSTPSNPPFGLAEKPWN